jgi:hypothetical protein
MPKYNPNVRLSAKVGQFCDSIKGKKKKLPGIVARNVMMIIEIRKKFLPLNLLKFYRDYSFW